MVLTVWLENLNNNTIVNLRTDGKDLKSAVNVDFMQSEITSMSDLVSQTLPESHVGSSTNKKDAFSYLMETQMNLRVKTISMFWVLMIIQNLHIK